MENAGYLYVLANSCMPGLVKVGKTTRTPSERAQELAGVTGVPVPFIVVYEQLFEDCHAAEAFVHGVLAQSGFRISDNREFFNVPANVAVRAIIKAPGAVDSDVGPAHRATALGASAGTPAEASPPSFAAPYDDLLLEGLRYQNGSGDYLQDDKKAFELFKQAAKLGSVMALDKLGECFEGGRGAPKNLAQALSHFQEGARRGNPQCHWSLGRVYMYEKHYDNAEKCFAAYFACLTDENTVFDEVLINKRTTFYDAHTFLFMHLLGGSPIPPTLDLYIRAYRGSILDVAEAFYERDSRDIYRRIIVYLNELTA